MVESGLIRLRNGDIVSVDSGLGLESDFWRALVSVSVSRVKASEIHGSRD